MLYISFYSNVSNILIFFIITQWAKIKGFIVTTRKIKKDLRDVLNCILKITRTGFQWRNTDKVYGSWGSVYYYFRKWKNNGSFDAILAQLVEDERVR